MMATQAIPAVPGIPGMPGMPGIPGIPGMPANMVGQADPRKTKSKPFSVKSYSVDVFDMHNGSDRDRYSELMLRLFSGAVDGRCIVWKNELQVMTRADGSSAWMRYVEWSDNEVNIE